MPRYRVRLRDRADNSVQTVEVSAVSRLEASMKCAPKNAPTINIDSITELDETGDVPSDRALPSPPAPQRPSRPPQGHSARGIPDPRVMDMSMSQLKSTIIGAIVTAWALICVICGVLGFVYFVMTKLDAL